MDISPIYSTNDWNALDLSNPIKCRASWERAILIFEDHIRGRFLNIVDNIQSLPYSGFVVMAIDCLLMETLEQFYCGVPDSIGGNKKFFTDFLDRSVTLSQEFDDNQKMLLYEHYRCGILHQAEIKGNSLVKRVGPLVKNTAGNGIIVNRQKFHKILVSEFDNYTQKLRAENPVDVDLRLKFRTKMDYLCRKPQYYFAFRTDITDQALCEQLGDVTHLDHATLVGWKVKTNRKGDLIGIEPDESGSITGNVYQLSVELFDKLPASFERDNKPIPVQVKCPTIPQFQMVWVFSRNRT